MIEFIGSATAYSVAMTMSLYGGLNISELLGLMHLGGLLIFAI